MKTLKIIQTLAKIGRIVSKIVFICCIIGFCGCIVGIICLVTGMHAVKIHGVTLDVLLKEEADISLGFLYAITAASMPLCVGEAVLAKFAERFFGNEIKEATPFSLSVAKEMLRLGILTICIPIGSVICAEIVFKIMQYFFTDVPAISLSDYSSVGIGVVFIIVSLFCRLGAEQKSEKESQPFDKEEKNS